MANIEVRVVVPVGLPKTVFMPAVPAVGTQIVISKVPLTVQTVTHNPGSAYPVQITVK